MQPPDTHTSFKVSEIGKMSQTLYFACLCVLYMAIPSNQARVASPYGVRMCVDLCLKLSECETPVYVLLDLSCYPNITTDVEGIRLPVPKDETKGRSGRKSITKPKGEIMITGRKSKKPSAFIAPEVKGYRNLQAGGKAFVTMKSKRKAGWARSQIRCQSDGARLVKLDTEGKQAVVYNEYLQVLGASLTGDSLWIGLRRLKKTGGFQWIDGNRLGSVKWMDGNPRPPQDNCVAIRKQWRKGLVMITANCHSKKRFICELLQ